jgi:hypothetical protein
VPHLDSPAGGLAYERYLALSEANSAFLLFVLVILLIVLAVSSIARRCCGLLRLCGVAAVNRDHHRPPDGTGTGLRISPGLNFLRNMMNEANGDRI